MSVIRIFRNYKDIRRNSFKKPFEKIRLGDVNRTSQELVMADEVIFVEGDGREKLLKRQAQHRGN